MKEGNWHSGETVPRTGTYKCIYCGPAGMGATILKHAMESMSLPYVPPPTARKQPPFMFFTEGNTFPSCPNCKEDPSGSDTTGWDFVSEKAVTKDSRCFIATACCDSANAPEVLCLRQFRDLCLMPHATGRAFVIAYYALSPPLAAWIRSRPGVQAAFRRAFIGPLARWACARLKGAAIREALQRNLLTVTDFGEGECS